MSKITLVDVLPTLERNIRLFLQINVGTKSPTMSGLDLLEMIKITEEGIRDQLSVMKVVLYTGTLQLNGYEKYKKDTSYVRFWNDVESNIQEMLNLVFLHIITLSTCTKQSPHPMLSKYYSLILTPIIEHFQQFHPENVLVGSIDFFKELNKVAATIEVSTHATDMLVAKATIKKILSQENSTSAQKAPSRLNMIKIAVHNLRV